MDVERARLEPPVAELVALVRCGGLRGFPSRSRHQPTASPFVRLNVEAVQYAAALRYHAW
jgi:hypothetical protein